MLKIIENLFLFYDLDEETVYNEMGADKLTTFIMAYNDALFYNMVNYKDLWDYNVKGAPLFYKKEYNGIKNILINNGIKSFDELKTNADAFKQVFNLIENN